MWGLNPFLSECNTLHINLEVHMFTIRQIILWISLCSHQAVTGPSKYSSNCHQNFASVHGGSLGHITWYLENPARLFIQDLIHLIRSLPECFMTLQDSQAVCYMLSSKIILWISWRIFLQHLQEFWYPPYSACWPHHVYSKPERIHYPTQLNFHFFWTYLNRFVFAHL